VRSGKVVGAGDQAVAYLVGLPDIEQLQWLSPLEPGAHFLGRRLPDLLLDLSEEIAEV
jgi:hypothetical protein